MTEQGNSEAICRRARELDLAAFALDRAATEWAEFRAHYAGCPECAPEVARFARLAVLLEREAAPAPAHPAERELLAYADSRAELAATARERIARHLAGCAACRSEVAVLQRFDLGALEAAPSGASASERIRRAVAWLGDVLRGPLRAPAFALAAAVLAIAIVASWSWREPSAAPPDASVPPLAAAPAPAGSESAEAADREAVAAAPRSEPLPAPQPAAEIALAPSPPSAPAPQESAPPAEPETHANAPSPSTSAPGPPEEPPPPQRIAALIPAEAPRYARGALAAGPLVRVASVGRGANEGAPSPIALAPPQLGLTTRESPSLYWFLPGATPLPVAVSMVSEAAPAPLLDLTLLGPHAAGVHELSLAERGVRLAAGVDCQWFVAVVRDPERRSRDLVSSAAIRYAPPSDELAARLADAKARLAHVYAEAGLWYDAYDQLSHWIANEPDAAILRAHRAALLEQVGLAAAASELSAAPASAPDP